MPFRPLALAVRQRQPTRPAAIQRGLERVDERGLEWLQRQRTGGGIVGSTLGSGSRRELVGIRQPASFFTFMDEDAEAMSTGAFWVNPAPTTSWWMIPGARDRGDGANVAYADGHVEPHQWKFRNRRWLGRWGQEVANELDRADLTWVVSKIPSIRP